MKITLKKIFVIIIALVFLFTQISSVRATPDITPTLNPTPTTLPQPNPTLTPPQIPTPTLEITGEPTNIITGDITDNSTSFVNANANILIDPLASNSASDQLNSNQNNSTTIINNNETTQTNNSNIQNNAEYIINTGNNSTQDTSKDSSIKTGDVNSNTTIINVINTNVEAIAVSEFNIVDDHKGDLVLDFKTNCVSGCDVTTNTSNSFQRNDATLENNIILTVSSGNNDISNNKEGNSTIETGNVYVSANVLNFVNNNISGNVLYGVVNVYGTLEGDIILPKSVMESDSTSSGSAVVKSSVDDKNSLVQKNEATITNNIEITTVTGENQITDSKTDNAVIKTGSTETDVKIVNVVNTNIVNDSLWMVIINKAGEWIGKIVGDNEKNYADKTITNSKQSIEQINNAQITNNLHLFAITGNNTLSQNSGQNSNIKTGDAKAIANVVNFVNNNILGTGKLVVAVVNLFGKWMGDFKAFPTATSAPALTPTPTPTHTLTPTPTSIPTPAFPTTTSTPTSTAQSSGSTTQVTPTPTPTAANSISFRQRAAISFVAGAQTTRNNKPFVFNPNKRVSVNLAWLLLTLPIAGPLVVKRVFPFFKNK